MGRIKKKSKKPKSKRFGRIKEKAIEEWNNIPKDYIKKLFNNFRKRCTKIIELKGGRLEHEHLRDISKEMEKEEVNEEKMDEEKT